MNQRFFNYFTILVFTSKNFIFLANCLAKIEQNEFLEHNNNFLYIKEPEYDELPSLEGKYFYSDVSTDKLGIHYINLKIGSHHEDIRL